MARAIAETAPENRNRLMIIAAVVFAAIAALLLFVALQNANDGGGAADADTEVVVASQDIDPNTRVTSDMLEVTSVPADQALSGVYGTTDAVVGLPTRYLIQQGEQVTTSKIGVQQIQDEKDISLTINPGMRAFGIEASEVSAIGGNLLAGNYVDVIVVFEDAEANIRFTTTVLQNLRVLSVAQEALEPVPAAPTPAAGDQATGGVQSERPTDIERQPGAQSVTLEVTPEQAQILASLQTDTNDFEIVMQLALRGADDNDIVEPNFTDLNRLFSPPLPSPQP